MRAFKQSIVKARVQEAFIPFDVGSRKEHGNVLVNTSEVILLSDRVNQPVIFFDDGF